MPRAAFFLAIFSFAAITCFSQDSVWVKLRPKYNGVSGLHRVFFGENYRREWSDSTRLPVIDLAAVAGGLRPIRLGGGHQTVSLRLQSASGDEWVLRNIEKDASVLLPEALRQTFAREVIDDAMSAQHPFSPLVVAALAEAVNVPHAHPRIGVVLADTLLGEFSPKFSGRVCLLEEREPMGQSENSLRMFRDLDDDNDNDIDGPAFLKARLLDLLIGDWDRHPDQWRWVDTRKGKSKLYVGIPRDRDQAFYLNQGVFPHMARQPWIAPILQGFNGKIRHVSYSLKEGSFPHSRPGMFMPYSEWMRITQDFVAKLTDSVIAGALLRLPAEAWAHGHEKLYNDLRERRDHIPAAIAEYYRFVNRIADIQLSNKNELISFSDNGSGALRLQVEKLGKHANKQQLVDAEFTPDITKEIRIYTGKGHDSIRIDNKTSPIRIRVIAADGDNGYAVSASPHKVKVYETTNSGSDFGNTDHLALRISGDSLNTAYVPTNRYNILMPLFSAGFNRDDGLILGFGLSYTHQGFRKVPYSSINKLLLSHSFATSAFRIKYSSEWIHVFGKADLVAAVDILAPENTHNFFGTGNETTFDKTGDYLTFYRSRFSIYQVGVGLRWRTQTGVSWTIGPSLQHYAFDVEDNRGRFLELASVGSYDSLTIAKNKTHAGLVASVTINKKNSQIIPTKGYFLNVKMVSYAGLGKFARSYGQLVPEFAAYIPVSKRPSITIAERIGGGISFGKPAFYQSVFAGGHENLLGYRQYRFAGEHLLYNNVEARIRLTNFTGYIIPGEFGMLGFYDIGRVWVKDEHSDTWHQGVGGGLYFAPAKMAVLTVVAGHSTEGWYPYITLGFRF